MALEATGRDAVLVPDTIHPDTGTVLRTYLENRSARVIRVPAVDGRVDRDALRSEVNDRVAAVVIQTPNFFGLIEEVREISAAAKAAGALLVAVVDPISLGVLAPPGEYGADIAAGDGQPLGNPVSFGGPSFGFLAARKEHMRRMPGRIVGETRDGEGRRAFVLTLQAREQHIRREKATSNICTNQGLCALRGAIYLVGMGKAGLRRVAHLCLQKAHYAAQQITSRTPFTLPFSGPFFREFVIQGPLPAAEANRRLFERGIIGGFDLGRVLPEESQSLLLAFSELNTRDDIDALVSVLGGLG
jgi:glycine dehydrogenase subunit 1